MNKNKRSLSEGTVFVQPNHSTVQFGFENPLSYLHYEEIIQFKKKLKEQEIESEKKRLKESYPIVYAIIHSFFLIALSAAQITIQIIIIQQHIPSLYSGIWAGGYYFITAILPLVLIFKRDYAVFVAAIAMHFIGCFVGFVVFAINMLSKFKKFCLYPSDCENINTEYYIYLIVFGIICSIICFLYPVITDTALNGSHDPNQIHIIQPETIHLPVPVIKLPQDKDNKANPNPGHHINRVQTDTCVLW